MPKQPSKPDLDREYLRQMINTTTANVLAMRGIVTLLVAGIPPTEEKVLELLSPLLNRDSPASQPFAELVDQCATSILSTAERLRSEK